MSTPLKEQVNPEFEWCDSQTFIVNDSGELVEAGTCLLLQGQVIFLKGLTSDQLLKLKDAVVSSVGHELSKRDLNLKP